MEKLIGSLRKKGLKITPQRLAIFKTLKDDKSHPCAEEIYLKVREDYPTISLATVYQTLDTLENILRCCGIETRLFDAVCAECMSSCDHKNFTKCKDARGKTQPSIRCRCSLEYCKRHDIPPPAELQEMGLVTKLISERFAKGESLPEEIYQLKLEYQVCHDGSIDEIKATTRYRVQLLSFLSKG